MSKKDIRNLRSTIEFLKKENELLSIQKEIDPILEISGMEKTLEGGPALLFEKIKGYPDARNVGESFRQEGEGGKLRRPQGASQGAGGEGEIGSYRQGDK